MPALSHSRQKHLCDESQWSSLSIGLDRELDRVSTVDLTLNRSVSIRLLGTLTALTSREGPVSMVLLSPELGVTHSITGWVVPSSWLSTCERGQEAASSEHCGMLGFVGTCQKELLKFTSQVNVHFIT